VAALIGGGIYIHLQQTDVSVVEVLIHPVGRDQGGRIGVRKFVAHHVIVLWRFVE
jgi:hypothetical protein